MSTVPGTSHTGCRRVEEELRAEVTRLTRFVNEKDAYIQELQGDIRGGEDWVKDLNRQVENLTSYARARDTEIEGLKARNQDLGETFIGLTVGKTNALRDLAAAEQRIGQMERANRVLTHQCERLRSHIPDDEAPLCTGEGCEFRFEMHGDRIRLFPIEGS